ncbi:MAG: sigma 54-interacting transcriptional regulator, partial [Acidobacteriota bacterium]
MPEAALKSVELEVAPQPRPSLTLVNQRAISYDSYESFVGVSQNVNDLKNFIGLQATQAQPVLLIGERGLRQEQVARALHQACAQWSQPFFAVNAHGLSGEALHGLLFGPQGQYGMIETVKQGTIYINELTCLPLLLQQRFAVYLEEHRWRERGGNGGRQRLIFASEWNPADRTAENRIAFGLVEMLRPSSFTIKPLRERSEDIQPLAKYLLERIAHRQHKSDHVITAEA